MTSPRTTPRRADAAAKLVLWLVAATTAMAALAGGSAGATTTPSAAGARSLAVSVPPDPVAVAAGESAKTAIRVINPGAAPITVTVTGRGVQLGDNGALSLAAGEDRSWQARERFPSGPLSIPARGYLDVPLAIRVPARVAPDLYFVGFLVTPQPTAAGNVQIVNQIGAFVTVDVPGPRLRKLRAALQLPSVVVGDHAQGTLSVVNTGRAAVRFWGEGDTTSSPRGSARQARIEPALLPVGTSRSITVSGSPAWPIGMVTVTMHVVYPGRTEQSSKEIVLRGRVLVISPWAIPALSSLVVAALGILLWRRRSRRARRRAGLQAGGD